MTTGGKSRLNKKFIILIGGFLLFVGVVLAGLWWYTNFAAPEKNMQRGDALVAEAQALEKAGDADGAYKQYQEAVSRYGRAVSKQPNNLAFSQKMLDALSLMTPKTASDAQELYGRREALLQRRTRSAPLDGKQWMALLDSQIERARTFGQLEMWQAVASTAEEAQDRVPESDPLWGQIRSIGLAAQLNREELLTVEDRTEVEGDALEVLKANPKDPELWCSLLVAVGNDVLRLSSAGQSTVAKAREEEFGRLLAESKQANPNDSQIAIVELMHLSALRRSNSPLATPQAIRNVLDPLLWSGGDRASDKPGKASELSARQLVELAGVVGSLEEQEAVKRAIALLEAAVSKSGTPILELNALARLQRVTGDLDRAIKTYDTIVSMPPPKVSMLAAYADDVRAGALEEIFTIRYAQMTGASDSILQASQIAALKEVRERLVKVVGTRDGDLATLRCDAKIAFAEGDYLTTITKLEDLFARQKRVPPEFYLLAATALGQRGEQGAALIKINQGLDEYPNLTQFYLVRAGLEARLGRIAEARRSVQLVLTAEPGNVVAQQLAEGLAKVRGDGVLNLADDGLKALGNAEQLANEGNIEGALAIVRDALTRMPDDIRLRRTLVQWLLFMGKQDEAKASLAVYLADTPNDGPLQSMKILAEIKSPVERVAAYADQTLPDGSKRSDAERAVVVATTMLMLRDALATRVKTVAEPDRAMVQAQLDEAKAALDKAVPRALEVAPGDAVLLDRLFAEALQSDNQVRLQELIVIAEQHSQDKAIPFLMRGRMALAKSDIPKAIQAFEQAVALAGSSAASYRLLGMARERGGDMEGAREALSTAFDRAPDDPLTIQLYSTLLARNGQTTKAREVLRTAMQALPGNPDIRNAYLDLEAAYGNRAGSLIERARLYSVRPSDVDNARQLMRLLIETPVTSELVLDDNSMPVYQPKEWEALGKERQEAIIAEYSKMYAERAQGILEGLLRANQSDNTSVRFYAAALQRAGRGREGAEMLRSAAEKLTGAMQWSAWVDLGELYLEMARDTDADAAFAKAIELDSSATNDAAQAVAQIWANRRVPRRSLDVLEAVYAKAPTLELARTIAALRLEVRDFKGAKEMSAEIMKQASTNVTFTDRLLAADIANAEMDQPEFSGTPADEARVLGEMNKALDEAIKIDPASALPFMVRAASFQRRYQKTGNPDMARQALQNVERAIELRGNYWPATRLLASIHTDRNDIAAAIDVCRKFVEQNPRSVEARRALIAYQLGSGDFAGAISTASAAVADEPRNQTWIQALCEAQAIAGMKLEAASSYQTLFSITANPDFLMQAIVLRATNSPPDLAGVLRALQAVPAVVPQVPFLQMMAAAALAVTGDTELARQQGRQQLRELVRLVDPSKGVSGDQWVLAASTLYPGDKMVDFEKFVTECAGPNPSSPLLVGVAQRFAETGPDWYDKAFDFGTRALQAAANDEDRFAAYRLLGNIEYRRRNMTKAVENYEKALALQPDDLLLLNNVAYLEAAELGKVSEAIERARRALAVNPVNADLMDTLGYSLTKKGDYPEAIGLLRRASRIQANPTTYAHLALAQWKGGFREDATASLTRAKALRPDSEAQREINLVEREMNGRTDG
jgi:tetratricopeptide (TPR) repeat protein